MRLFHIVAPAVWAGAVEAGEYRPPSLAAEGFVHFSFADQVAGTANARYRDEPELVVLELDSDDVPHELRIEDSYNTGTDFPHIYGPIPTDVAHVRSALRRADNGDWVFTPGG